MENNVLLEIKDLQVQYVTERGTGNALNGLTLTIHKGESLGLVGETGAGKTTAALSVLNLLPKPAGRIIGGEILYNGKSVQKMSNKELMDIRGKKISMIFQNPLTSLNPVFTIGEQISMVIRKHEKCTHRQADEKTKQLLEEVGIPGSRLHDYPSQFSGGMRQRVGIAAGIALNPELLIADEPTTALDVTIQAQILELMKKLKTQYDTSLLMITHNLGIISELCENVAVIYGGRIIEHGPVKDVFGTPLHPYTAGLLGAIPSLEGKKERLHAIPGKIAGATNLPAGCAFHPRCEMCIEKCKSQVPPMATVRPGHNVACFVKAEGK
ncbi:ABC transporter ATP-binding protein [Ruminococcaceae bacterium OttesenSCG-928-A16]|nr:ABC transporter ATP-binding protein [Ruminococcaceae bacterium OttesenSCG-928-A16]